jgi:hypothetical protein
LHYEVAQEACLFWFWLVRLRRFTHENAARHSGPAGERHGPHRRILPLGILHTKGQITDTPWGTREFSVVDPDNNLITLYENV